MKRKMPCGYKALKKAKTELRKEINKELKCAGLFLLDMILRLINFYKGERKK